MTRIPNYEQYCPTRACSTFKEGKCSRSLLKGEYVRYIIIGKVSKSVKV